MYPTGKKVYGRISNTAVNTTPVEIVFKDCNGDTHTLAVGERLVIYEVSLNNRATAKDLTILHDLDAGTDLDAGEEIVTASFGAAGYEELIFQFGLPTKRITVATQKLYALASAAGAVDVLVVAEIIKS
jgi:hypothetical protein